MGCTSPLPPPTPAFSRTHSRAPPPRSIYDDTSGLPDHDIISGFEKYAVSSSKVIQGQDQSGWDARFIVEEKESGKLKGKIKVKETVGVKESIRGKEEKPDGEGYINPVGIAGSGEYGVCVL